MAWDKERTEIGNSVEDNQESVEHRSIFIQRLEAVKAETWFRFQDSYPLVG